MTQQATAPDKFFSGIELPKVLAGTLAAVSAAVLGSFLGVTGTLVGAAIASVVGSVGTELYAKSIQRGTKKLQTFTKAPAAVGTPEVAAATEEDSPSQHAAAVTPARKLRWKPILIGAGLVFVVAMGAILAVELLAGRSLASMTGDDAKGGTTITHLVGNDSDSGDERQPAPAVSEEPTATPSPDTTDETTTEPTTGPTESATSDDGGEPATTAPTATEAPAPDAPQQEEEPPAQQEEPPAPEQQQQQQSGAEE